MADEQMTKDQVNRIAILEARLRRLEDIEEIRKLRAIYCNGADGGWPEQGPTHMGPFADLYVEDGVWDGRPMTPLAEGREAIRKLIELGSRPITFIQHYSTNPNIDIGDDGNTATGKWHVMAPMTGPDGVSRWVLGTYDEKYVRTSEGWRFKSTRFIPSRIGEQPSGWSSASSPVA